MKNVLEVIDPKVLGVIGTVGAILVGAATVISLVFGEKLNDLKMEAKITEILNRK